MRQPGVLVDFAEQILTIDQLQVAAIQTREAKPQAAEVFGLRVAHVPDEVGFDPSSSGTEALTQSVPSARSWDDEIHLIEVDQRGVIDVDEELERQKAAHSRVTA
jgi:hypothetical protein